MANNVSKTGFPNIPLKPGMILKLEARSPSTDAAVTGVSSSKWSIWARDLSDEPELDPQLPTWVPQGEAGIV